MLRDLIPVEAIYGLRFRALGLGLRGSTQKLAFRVRISDETCEVRFGAAMSPTSFFYLKKTLDPKHPNKKTHLTRAEALNLWSFMPLRNNTADTKKPAWP